MGRLTESDGQGNWWLKGVPWKDTYVGQTITANTSEKIYGALCKLKDYEDTGLTPEEVNSLNTFDGSQAVKATIKLQEEQRKHRWIPVSERLPDEHEKHEDVIDPYTLATIDTRHHTASNLVQVTVKDLDKDELFVCDECTVDGKWSSFESEGFEVIAWMPLPEPYKPEEVQNGKDTKIKVTSAEIVVHGTAKKPCFEIKYQEIGSNHYNIGFSSYKLDFVFQWLKEYFEIVSTDLLN